MNRLALSVMILMQLGLTAPLTSGDKLKMQDMAVSMWMRSELRSEGVSILDVGCGNGLLMPKLVNYFENVLGIKVNRIMGIDIGTWSQDRHDGELQVNLWNKKLQENHGDRYSIKHMDIMDIRNLGHKFNFVFYVAPHPAWETGKRARQVMKVMKDDGVMIIIPHLWELSQVVNALKEEKIVFTESYMEKFKTFFPLEEVSLIVKRSELRDSKVASIFAGILSRRIIEQAA